MSGDQEFRAYFSEDDTEAYVLTESLPKIMLRENPVPGEAPVYVDIETGYGVYPEEISPETAAAAAEYAFEKASREPVFHLSRDTEAWREEFSNLLAERNDPGSSWSLDLDERDPYDESF